MENLKRIADFISVLNSQEINHVGFCGKDKDEILDSLLNDFSDLPLDQSMVTLSNEHGIIGVLGLDIDKDSQTGELWGPFIYSENWQANAKKLWDKLFQQIDIPIKKVYGFYNQKNKKCLQFMKVLKAKKKKEYEVLKFNRQPLIKSYYKDITNYSNQDVSKLTLLHSSLFPDTYYTIDDIKMRINENNQLIFTKDETGYIYCEANPKFNEGTIHYIGVNPDFRRKGIGKSLLQKGLEFLFSFDTIHSIDLCVDQKNVSAIKLYKSIGFETQYELISYEIIIK